MLDILKRSLVSVISVLVIVYMMWMMVSGVVIVQAEYVGMNIIASLLVIIIAFYLLLVYGVYPFYHPMQKRILAIVGLICIGVGHYVLANDVNTGVYAGDILKLFGVLVVWFGATGVMTQNKTIQSQKREKSLEIIEA